MGKDTLLNLGQNGCLGRSRAPLFPPPPPALGLAAYPLIRGKTSAMNYTLMLI